MIYYFSGYGEGKNYIEKILYPGFKSPVEFLLQAFSGIHILCGLSFFLILIDQHSLVFCGPFFGRERADICISDVIHVVICRPFCLKAGSQ